MSIRAFKEESRSERHKATFLRMEKSKITETEKDETGEEQSQDHDHPFL
jgi:hypothetical protein